jgi:hypothetical protein
MSPRLVRLRFSSGAQHHRCGDCGGNGSNSQSEDAHQEGVMNSKIEAAMKMLDEQGHTAIRCSHKGQDWYHPLDCHVLVKPLEMEELCDGVYSFEELMELFCKRRLEEQGLL